ncbi:QueT transporter family protein [Nonomuraea basaltis]|uniref:QueT transporter family protein n=1 Tax=Nonomuraea basaltis TaxID=2495887 RepID=UPI00110C6917|nr:QueT transporter family protein [Nonomuraea basaltis]TMR97507.1 QueT transporter family protein [Nonomuraea basaltis]
MSLVAGHGSPVAAWAVSVVALELFGAALHLAAFGVLGTLLTVGAGMLAVLVVLIRRDTQPSAINTIGAALWLLAATWLGPFGAMALALLVGSAVLSYLRQASRPRLIDRPRDPHEQPPDPRRVTWETKLAAPGKPLQGVTLGPITAVPGGWSAPYEVEPGDQQASLVVQRVGNVASAYRASISQVMPEPSDTDNAAGRLTVIARDNLAQVRTLEDDGPSIDLETGKARVGYFGDLSPTHTLYWTSTGGAAFALTAGDSNSGKSRYVETDLALAHDCPLIGNVLLDAQDGSSQPDFADAVPLYAEGVEECFETLQALDFVLRRRAWRVAHPGPWIDAQGRERTRGKPFLLPGDPDLDSMELLNIVLEELPMLLTDDTYGKRTTKILANGAKTWRKAGGRVHGVVQLPDLAELKSQAFRAQLRGNGTVVAFRTSARVAQSQLGMAADPSKLPQFFRDGSKTHGLAYIASVDRRHATFRGLLTADPFSIAQRPAKGGLSQVTLDLLEEYRAQKRKGRAPKPPKLRVEPPAPGDVQAAVEAALARAGGPLDLASIGFAVNEAVPGCPLSAVKDALRRGVADDTVIRIGDGYEAVDRG